MQPRAICSPGWRGPRLPRRASTARWGAEFDLDTFRQKPVWNGDDACVETHVESLQAHDVRLGDHVISFAGGEIIHTENSHKYSIDVNRPHKTGPFKMRVCSRNVQNDEENR